MSARHRDNPTPAQGRLRVLVVAMLAILTVGVVFFRGSAADSDGSDGETPVSGATTSTTSDGGTATTATNPAKMESWQLHSYLTYQLAGQTYVKARSTVRTQ